jgi:glutamine synthetase
MVLVGLPDINGALRGKAMRGHVFKRALQRGSPLTDLILALDPVDAPITDYQNFGIKSGAADLVVTPDASTLHTLTWRPGWHVCLATPRWADGSPCALASREVLRSAVEVMSAEGYDVVAALEYEIRLFDSEGAPVTAGLSYSLTELGRVGEFVELLLPALDALEIQLTAVHTEAGRGLLEVNIAARSALQAADDAILLRFAFRQLARSIGLRASFLAKPVPNEEGSSGHVHLSCWQSTRNAFAWEGPPASLPPTLSFAVAGILEHLPASSLLLNPTINSYKRLVPGWFAPVNVSWGVQNRSAAVRVVPSPEAADCRVECRRPGADANPYLCLAALINSAADGLRRRLPLPSVVELDASDRTDLQVLPNSLEEALRAFGADSELRRALGEEFSAYFAVSRAWELKSWQQAVTDWERQRYEGTI